MRSKLFGAASALPTPPGCSLDAQPEMRDIPGLGPSFNMPGILRFMYELDLGDINVPSKRDGIELLQRRVNEALDLERAQGREPDLQRTINTVCDLPQFGRDMHAAIGGAKIDATERLFARLERQGS